MLKIKDLKKLYGDTEPPFLTNIFFLSANVPYMSGNLSISITNCNFTTHN